jgi:hypothetical protein
LLEAYVDGPEFSVEGYVTGGQVHFVSVTEKLLSAEPYFVELGHIVQANLSESTIHAIKCYTTRVVNALGVNLGPVHCEIRLGQKGPVVMELAARLAGDRICDLIDLALGVSLPRIMIETYLSIIRCHPLVLRSVATQGYASS